MAIVVTRGETYTFKATFFEDDGSTPLIPLNSSYPSYSVYNISNALVTSGIAVQDGPAGNYKFDFFVALNAELSYSNKSWRLEWMMITDGNNQVSQSFSFDVQAAEISATEEAKDQNFITLANKQYRALISFPSPVYSLELEVVKGNSTTTILSTTTPIGSFTTTTTADGSTVYYVDLPPTVFKDVETYLLTWTVQDNVASALDFVVQRVYAIPLEIFSILPSIRSFIDRLQKTTGSVYGYSDGDLYEYLLRGMDLLNNFFPRSTFSYRNIPGSLVVFWIYLSSFHALQAQYLLDGELAFNATGQTTSLEVDHSGIYSEAIGRLQEFVNENLSRVKYELQRQSTPVATVAGRPYSARNSYNMVYRFNIGSAVDLAKFLGNLGILL